MTEWTDSENSPDGTELSRVLRIRSKDSFKAGDRVSLEISGAKNYAGKVLATDSRTLTVEARPAEIALNYAKAIAIKSGDTIELYTYVKDADGRRMAGRTVSISLDNQTVAELKQSSAVTDSNGRAKFTLTGVLPGLAALKASVEDSILEMDIPLRVTLVQERPERPTAQVGAYTFGPDAPKENSITVEAGTMLTIAAEEGTVIYYTTDDTCPCQEGTRKEYTGAISIPEGMTRFRIAAYKEGMAYSEYSERLNLNVTGTKKVNQDITVPKEDKPASVTPPKTEIKKVKQPMKVTVKKVSVKKAKLKKKKLTVKVITVKKAQGTVTFQKVKKGSSKKLEVNKKTGKITIKKGTQKGTYKMKVKITAKGNDRYLSGSRTVTVTVKIR